MQNYELDEPDPLFYHRLVESFKWAYAARTRLGDPADPEYGEQVESQVEEMVSEAWAREKFLSIKDSSTQSDPAYYGAEFYNQEDSGTAHLSVLDKCKTFQSKTYQKCIELLSWQCCGCHQHYQPFLWFRDNVSHNRHHTQRSDGRFFLPQYHQ